MAKGIVTSILFFAILVAGFETRADYMTFGFGTTKYGQKILEKPSGLETFFYAYPGFDMDFSLQPNAYHFGYGKKINRRWDYQIGYYALGELSGFAGWVSDDHVDTIRGGRLPCSHDCTPTIWEYTRESTQAFAFTVLPKLHIKKVTLYGRIGLAYYRTESKHWVVGERGLHDPFGTSFREVKPTYKRDITYVLGYGARSNFNSRINAFIDLTCFADISTSQSHVDRACVTTGGVMIGF